MLKIVQGCKDSRLDLWVTRDWQATKVGTRVEHAGELKSHASYCTTGKKSQAGQAVSSRLELVTQPSCEAKSPNHLVWEKLTFHIPSHPTIYRRLYPRNVENFQRENFERETLEKTRLIHSQSSHRDSSNPSTLFLSIVKTLRGTLPKPFLTIPISVKRLFGALRSS